MTPIMTFIKAWVRETVLAKQYTVPPEVKALFEVLGQMIKTRGYKTVVKFFPHEVSDTELVTELLHF